MKAFVLGAFGQAPKITELEIPSAAPGEVRVRVRAASINGFDVAVANGYLNGMMEHRFPVVLGKDFSGTIDQVGEGVDGYRVGDRVFGVVTKDFLGDGSFAEYVTVPVAVGLAHLPDEVSFTDAAGLGLAGTAALAAFDAAGIGTGTTVLIAGATGGVGNQAVQWALRAGANVIATAHSAEQLKAVAELGANTTVDYTGDVAAQVHELHPDGVDVILHFAGNAAALVPALKTGGRFISALIQSPDQLEAEGIDFVPVFAHPSTAALDRLAKNHAENHSTVAIQRIYTLDESPEALGHFAGGKLGKLVISLG